jgi:hypothetical protein
VKLPTIFVVLSVVFVVLGCALHHPVPVTPGWPEESPLGCPLDAGDCVRAKLDAGVRGFSNH